MKQVKAHVVVSLKDNQVVRISTYPFTIEGYADANKTFDLYAKAYSASHGFRTTLLSSGVSVQEFDDPVKSLPKQKKTYVIHEYIRNQAGKMVGCMLAVGTCGEKFSIGWSKVNLFAGDKFDKGEAYRIAYGRATMPKENDPLPYSLEEFYDYFYSRCTRYFKVPEVVKNVVKDAQTIFNEKYVTVPEEQASSCKGCVFITTQRSGCANPLVRPILCASQGTIYKERNV